MSIEVEQTGSRNSPRRWAPAALAALALLAVGVITLGGGAQSGGTTTSIGVFSQEALEDQIPGFSGSIHVAITINRAQTYVIWHATESAPELIPIDTSNMVLNADLSQLAGLDFIAGGIGNVRVGVPGDIEAVTPDVTAFAWHDTDPSRIAVTRTLNDTSLWLADVPSDQNYLVFSGGSLQPDYQVVAFGDWGVAVHSPPDSDGHLTTLIVDEDGLERLRLAGEVVATRSGPGGGVMVADRRTGDVSVTWQTGSGGDGLYGVGDLLRVVWSDDFTGHAELRDGPEPGIDILLVRSGENELFSYENYVPRAWDASGRFLAVTEGRQLAVIDAEDGSVYELGIPRGIISDVRFGS